MTEISPTMGFLNLDIFPFHCSSVFFLRCFIPGSALLKYKFKGKCFIERTKLSLQGSHIWSMLGTICSQCPIRMALLQLYIVVMYYGYNVREHPFWALLAGRQRRRVQPGLNRSGEASWEQGEWTSVLSQFCTYIVYRSGYSRPT